MKLTKPIFWLLALLWFLLAIWWYSSSKCSTCNADAAGIAKDTSTTVNDVSLTVPLLSATDGSWQLQNNDNLRFKMSEAKPVFGASVSGFLDSLALHAKSIQPGTKFTVTGYYTASEKNTTTFENLGLARADALKKELIARGVPEANIQTAAIMKDDLLFQPADTLVGGVGFDFQNTAPAAATTEEKLLFEPRTVYFNTGKNTLNVTPELASYITKVQKYLAANADKKLLVTGYTDNVGKEDANIKLSANRAEFVKNELSAKGIPAAQIEAAGKGMADPIADNATAEGRAQNRRVTIALQ